MPVLIETTVMTTIKPTARTAWYRLTTVNQCHRWQLEPAGASRVGYTKQLTQHLHIRASTPHQPWNKCSIVKVRERGNIWKGADSHQWRSLQCFTAGPKRDLRSLTKQKAAANEKKTFKKEW